MNDFYPYITPAGIVTFALLVITVSLAFFKIKIKKRMKLHKYFGLLTLAAGAVHALLRILSEL